MVTGRWRVPTLTRKLLRDVWAMKGQALAIAAVVTAGVTMLVTYLSNFESLQRTLDSYYASERFADVFAAAVRAPEPVAARLAALPGVTTVETRVVADVVLDLPPSPNRPVADWYRCSIRAHRCSTRCAWCAARGRIHHHAPTR